MLLYMIAYTFHRNCGKQGKKGFYFQFILTIH